MDKQFRTTQPGLTLDIKNPLELRVALTDLDLHQALSANIGTTETGHWMFAMLVQPRDIYRGPDQELAHCEYIVSSDTTDIDEFEYATLDEAADALWTFGD